MMAVLSRDDLDNALGNGVRCTQICTYSTDIQSYSGHSEWIANILRLHLRLYHDLRSNST
jgi:hypothetical protein